MWLFFAIACNVNPQRRASAVVNRIDNQRKQILINKVKN